MARAEDLSKAGDELVKQDVITREELEQARQHEERSGTPWYKQLIQSGKVSFGAVEDVLRYEFHSKAKREAHETLGHRLVDMGALTEKSLKEALKEQNRNGRLLGKILLEGEYVTREQLAKALCLQHKLEYARLEDTPSEPEALDAVPESVALKNRIIPVTLEGDKLTVLIADPQVRSRLADVGVMLGKRLHPILTAVEDLDEEVKARYEDGEMVEEDVVPPVQDIRSTVRKVDYDAPLTEAVDPAEEAPQKESPMAQANDVDDVVEEDDQSQRFDAIRRQASGASVVKMVATILEGAANAGATDIHLDPQDPEMRVRYRIDGVLHDVMSIPANLEGAVVSRIKIMSDLDITDTRHPQDGHISMDIGEREFDVRVASLPTVIGERVVLRLLDQTSVLGGIKDLGLETEDEKKVTEIVEEPYGMVLVTGPTGSGKTTSLYAMLNHKNVMTDSIVTLEDPVEYQLSGINQVQIDTDIGMTFANVLRASLRQDIDVLLVGEIRDSETAQIAVRAAMTGHLVFSTLHTNDAPEAIGTLQNMGVPPYLISSALTAVLGQRLVRKICPDCRKGFKPTAALLRSVGLTSTTKTLYRGKGCDACYGTGNRDRTGIFEILQVTPAVRKLLAEDKSRTEILKAAKMKSMGERCRQKVKRGEVNPEEYLRVIRS
jgi:type IV pilus assembly protein PilB